jgi:lipoprotein-anchoring transpeptidase ErfK/SrfK
MSETGPRGRSLRLVMIDFYSRTFDMTRLTRRRLLAGAAGLTLVRPPFDSSAQTNPPIVPVGEDDKPDDAGTATPAGRYFGETGHNLKAPFLAKWELAGGKDGIGAPLSEERFQEGVGVSQTFEAVTLVFDPGLKAPWDVQAAHIPTEFRQSIAPNSARKKVSRAPGNGRFFAESGHSLSAPFEAFWNERGELPLIGLPTSEPFKSKETGLQTQVFERAVFQVDPSGNVGFVSVAAVLAEEAGLFGDPAFLPNPPIAGTTQLVKAPDGLRLRARPSLNADVIVLLPDNAEFIAAANETGDWYAGYADGFAGYVASEFLAEAPPLPEISPADWDTSIWQGAALGESNVRAEATTKSDIARVLDYGDEVMVDGWVKGEEVFTGANLWAKLKGGGYVYARNIGRNAPVAATPVPPDAPTVGRWIDVNLTQQLMVAYDGRDVQRVMVTTTGMAGWETPPGFYQILWRVPNETMESGAIGAEHFYKLEDVLFTQYFTDRGHAIHYAWWRTPQTIGRPGSHGCLNTLLDDAQFLWDWANIGTPVYVHR